jgi:hypothetical protein
MSPSRRMSTIQCPGKGNLHAVMYNAVNCVITGAQRSEPIYQKWSSNRSDCTDNMKTPIDVGNILVKCSPCTVQGFRSYDPLSP